MNRSPFLAARVLIADADRHLRRRVTATLNDRGIEVLDAENGLIALRILAQGMADILVLDPMLPGFEGLQGVRDLCQLRPIFQ